MSDSGTSRAATGVAETGDGARADRAARSCERDFVLVTGLPRSGTTWIGKLFDSHPDTLYRHEPDTVRKRESAELRATEASGAAWEERLKLFVDLVLTTNTVRSATKAPWFKKSYYSSLRWLARVPMLHAARVAGRVFGEVNVPDMVPWRDEARVRVVWKSISATPLLGAIARVMPRSRSIAILRHPCGHVASVLRGTRTKHLGATSMPKDDRAFHEFVLQSPEAKKRGMTEPALTALAPAARLAWRWVVMNDEVLASAAAAPGIMVVRYEDVCDEPEQRTRAMFTHVGLSWNEQSARFAANSSSEEDPAFFSVFKDSKQAAERWREELGAEDLEQVLAVVRGTRSGAAYEL